jgi:thiosulfate/3-mercaptopyruvate sulfurtransferase
MIERTLISADALRALLASGQPCVLLDCGFDLADPAAGARAHAQGHLPGAQHADLERDLSAPKTGRNGRHPLPSREAFAATVGRWGVRADTPVVCYDDQGSPYAARAWWMLRWLGHDAVAVLDGGRAALAGRRRQPRDGDPRCAERAAVPTEHDHDAHRAHRPSARAAGQGDGARRARR